MLLNLVCISTQFLSYPLVLPDDVNHFTEADARHLGEKYQNNTHLHLLPTTDRHLQSVVLQQLRLVQPSVPLRQHQPAARHTAVCEEEGCEEDNEENNEENNEEDNEENNEENNEEDNED